MPTAEQPTRECAESTVFGKHAIRTTALLGAMISAAAAEEPVTAMRDIVQVNVPLLSHENFEVRQAAHRLLRDEAHKTLDRLNPLPTVIRANLDDKGRGLTPEQRQRLRMIMEEVWERELMEPGRIAAPQESGRSLRDVLQDQFSLPIIACDAALETCIDTYAEGENGQTSLEALCNLCTYAECIPELSHTAITLHRASPGTHIRTNGYLFHIIRSTDNGPESTVFHAPDKAAILTVKTTTPSDTVSAVVEDTIFDWKTSGLQCTPLPHLKTPGNGLFDVVMGVLPEKKEMPFEEEMHMKIGPQFLRLGRIEKQENGVTAECDGTVFEDIPWPKTSCPQDMFMYQLVASNRIEGVDVQGKSVPLIVEDLSFDCRHFTCTIRAKEKPHALRVRAFSDIIEKTLEMP